MKNIRLFAAVAASVGVLGSSAAIADTHWIVTGAFSDGATLTGSFNLNAYGYLGAYDLETSAGPVLPAKSYVSGGATQPGAAYLDFTPSGRELRLNFASSLGTPNPHDALLITSFECQNFACSGPSAPERFIVSGFASAPEPTSWALMLIGVAGLGAAMRRRRGAAVA